METAEPELVDTHCHLYLEELKPDLEALMMRAAREGVRKIYMPSLNSQYLQTMFAVEGAYPGRCFSMLGIHPCYVDDRFRDELAIMEQWASKRQFAAIGEIGLDYYHDRTFEEQQKTAFREQITLALKYHLPIVIHSRSSMEDCMEILQEYSDKGLRGIFHCFSGTVQQALDIIRCGFMLGIGGVVTYKNAGLAEVVAEIPLGHIVLETDAPYLPPVPFRGKRNESSYLKYIVARIAALKEVPVEEVARVTTANAKKVFG